MWYIFFSVLGIVDIFSVSSTNCCLLRYWIFDEVTGVSVKWSFSKMVFHKMSQICLKLHALCFLMFSIVPYRYQSSSKEQNLVYDT